MTLEESRAEYKRIRAAYIEKSGWDALSFHLHVIEELAWSKGVKRYKPILNRVDFYGATSSRAVEYLNTMFTPEDWVKAANIVLESLDNKKVKPRRRTLLYAPDSFLH